LDLKFVISTRVRFLGEAGVRDRMVSSQKDSADARWRSEREGTFCFTGEE